jgi:hypothetical protein
MTCWRRLRDWQHASVWEALHLGCWTGWTMTARSTGRGRRSTAPACGPAWGELTGANPVDRGKPGSKYQLIDAGDLPPTVGLSPANVHDSQLLEEVLDAPGWPRRRPAKLHGDKATTTRAADGWYGGGGSARALARPGVESTTRLGRHRWKVERSLAWLLATGA